MAVAGRLPRHGCGGETAGAEDLSFQATLTRVVVARRAADTDVEVDESDVVVAEQLEGFPTALGGLRTGIPSAGLLPGDASVARLRPRLVSGVTGGAFPFPLSLPFLLPLGGGPSLPLAVATWRDLPFRQATAPPWWRGLGCTRSRFGGSVRGGIGRGFALLQWAVVAGGCGRIPDSRQRLLGGSGSLGHRLTRPIRHVGSAGDARGRCGEQHDHGRHHSGGQGDPKQGESRCVTPALDGRCN